jgi:UDP-N-acetylmuramyl pentapeptide phosphotransferase/UDP-N-acetylglucosamine-1-phosphate transferase
VHWLPLVVSAFVALAIAPTALTSLGEHGMVRENYRQRSLPFPFGFLVPAAAMVSLVVLAPLYQLADADLFQKAAGDHKIHLGLASVAIYAIGAAFLGLADDMLSGPSRGWRGHAKAALTGAFSTGALKAVGALGLALFVLADRSLSPGDYLLAVAVVALTTNLFNLLDLRPGRSVKVFVLLGIGLTLGAWSLDVLWLLGLFVGPLLVAALYDLRERAMLGDTGANLIGGLAGLWLVLTLSTLGQEIALVVLLAITVYGELRSINALVERTPVLRHLDSLGRPR